METKSAWKQQREVQLINNRLIEIDGMKFHDIEGGFGEGKKSMVVKEIVEIHGQPLGEVNRIISDNRKRFVDCIDIIDIKTDGFKPFVFKIGFTKAQWGNVNNIYIL